MRTLILAAMFIGAAIVSITVRLPAPSAGAARAAETIVLTPEADAYVDQSRPATNFNTASAWPVEKDSMGRELYPLLRFDLSAIPEDSEVVDARLELWLDGGSGESPVDIEVQRVSLTWDQATVTWNNRPPTQGRWASQDMNTDPGWRTWNVRILTNNWVRGAVPNHGVVLRSGDEVEFERLFESTGVRKPRLVVEFEPPTPTPSATPTATGTATGMPTDIPTSTPTDDPTPTSTEIPTESATPTVDLTTTATEGTPTGTAATPTDSATPSATVDLTATASPTPSETPSPSPSPTADPTTTPTASPTTTPATPATPTTPGPTVTSETPSPIVSRIMLPIVRRD